MHRHRVWTERPLLEPEEFEVEREVVERILDGVVASGRDQLNEVEALEVIRAYGIPTVPYEVAVSKEEAVQAAEKIGFPVVLKVLSSDVVHKTDAGGVRIDLRSGSEVAEAFGQILQSVKARHEAARIQGVLVERYQKGGHEVIIGMSTDARFGPVLMFGLGGIYVETLRDVEFRIHPVTRTDADEMIRSVRGFPLLEGVRGEVGSDLEHLSQVIQRISQMVGDHDRISELDLNPFIALEDGGLALDARMTLGTKKSVSPTSEGR